MLDQVWTHIKGEAARGFDLRGRTTRAAFLTCFLLVLAICLASGLLPGTWGPVLMLVLLLPLSVLHVRRLIDCGWDALVANIVIWGMTATFYFFAYMVTYRMDDYSPFMTEEDLPLVLYTVGVWFIFLALQYVLENADWFFFFLATGLVLLPAPIITLVALVTPSKVDGPGRGVPSVPPKPASPHLREPWRTKRIVATLLASALLTGPVAAQDMTPEACLTPSATIDVPAALLQADGWTVLPQGEMPDDIADRLVWLYVAQYVTGDTGGEPLSSLLELQRRTVTGLARKRDIPTSTTRLLQRDGAAMLLMWREPVPGRFELQCRIALDAGSATTSFQRDPTVEVPYGTVWTIRTDAAALATETGRPVPGTLIETYLVYPAEAVQ